MSGYPDRKFASQFALSGNFDPEWYCLRYPDVAASGMDPAEHYLWIGQRLGRKPGPDEKGGSLAGLPEIGEGHEDYGFRSCRTFVDAERARFLQRLRGVKPAPTFKYRPKISVLVPAYKSPIRFLEMAVNSVLRQSYDNWELIIVDDGSNSAELDDYLGALPARDRRIIVQRNAQNGGISAATNCCLALASGEFIALFDHDDIMTLDALEKYVAVLNANPGLDLIYSDECRVDEADIPLDMFRKPGWSSAMLLNSMYTGHLSVYRRSIIDRVGGFRSAYDFSQDYDLALRVTELTNRIHHIPELLYGWRAIAGSGASGGKDFARESNIAALQDAMDRRGISGRAVPLPTANRADRTGALPSPLVSIIIPSDNGKHITEAVRSILNGTDYQHYEIVVVTNSRLIAELSGLASERVRFAPFDAKFNFSAKCNVGAEASNGDFYCFFNDDVRPISRDWVEALLEYGLMSDVGAVGAKLLYEDGTIQHAGMVTGVRNLMGTAFHCLPADTGLHFNMAQFVRDVSLLCGALILMPRSVYHAVEGWNETDFAIAHSDTDLCLKVWEAGFRCVYTPYASLVHIGHVSIGAEEGLEKKQKIKRKDKGEIALLRRWPREMADDPHWTHAMARAIYRDAQEYYRIHPGEPFPLGKGRDILIASHEMTQSGAPLMVLEMARILKDAGHFVTVIAPEDGPMREALNAIGITVIIDELMFSGHPTVTRLCAGFDVVIANTVVTWPLIRAIKGEVPVKWYIHESEFLHDYLRANAINPHEFAGQVDVWAVTSVPGRILQSYNWSPILLAPGVGEVPVPDEHSRDSHGIEVLVLGGYEPRKGQDLAVAMLGELPEALRIKLKLKFHGRTVDQAFHRYLLERTGDKPEVEFGDALSREAAQQAISRADMVLVCSRDESFSLVVVEALMHGSIVICSQAVGASEFLEDGRHCFVAPSPAPHDLAGALARALDSRDRWPTIREDAAALARQQFGEAAFRARLLDAMADCLVAPVRAAG